MEVLQSLDMDTVKNAVMDFAADPQVQQAAMQVKEYGEWGLETFLVAPTLRVVVGFYAEMPIVLTALAVMFGVVAWMTKRQDELKMVASENGTKRNLWKLNGKYYDLTGFLDKHPGGPRILMDVVNTDATVLMEMYHCIKNLPKIRLMMKQWEVDEKELTEEQKSELKRPIDFPDPMADPDYVELAGRVKQHLGVVAPDGKWKATWPVYVYYWALFFGFCLLYPAYAYEGSIAAALINGTIIFSLGVGCLHDGIHRVLSTKTWVNSFYAIAFGSSHDCHYIQLRVHVVNHHTNTNVEDMDADAHLALGIGHFGLVDKTWMPNWLAEFMMHVSVFIKATAGVIVYYFAAAFFTLSEDNMYRIPYLISQEYIRVRDLKYNHQMSVYWWVEGLVRLVWMYVLAVHPLIVAPSFAVAAQQIFLYHASWSLQVYITALCVHDNSKCDTLEPYIPGAHWGKWQITHGVDFNPYSTICNYWSIGQNNQIAHHLYPGVHWVYYPAISKIIADYCAEKDIQYHAFSSTWGMWVGHIREILARQPPFAEDMKRPVCYGYYDQGGEDKERRAAKLEEYKAKYGARNLEETLKVKSTWLGNAKWGYEQEAIDYSRTDAKSQINHAKIRVARSNASTASKTSEPKSVGAVSS